MTTNISAFVYITEGITTELTSYSTEGFNSYSTEGKNTFSMPQAQYIVMEFFLLTTNIISHLVPKKYLLKS